MSLEDIRILIDIKRNRELRSFIPWAACDFTMKACLYKWKDICLESFANVENGLRQLIITESKRIFENFQTSGLASAVKYFHSRRESHVSSTEALDILDSVADKTRTLIEAYCNWECRRPLTHNNEYFKSWQDRVLKHLLEQRYAIIGQPEQVRGFAAPPEVEPAPIIPEGLVGLVELAPAGAQFRPDEELLRPHGPG